MQPTLFPREITPDSVLAVLAHLVGPANGVTVRKLAQLVLGLGEAKPEPSDERELRYVIVKLRRDGHPICATPDEGYHHAANAQDLQRTCIYLTRRAMSSIEQVAAMQRVSVPDLYGQLRLPVPTANDESQGDSE